MKNRIFQVVRCSSEFTEEGKYKQRFFLWWEGDETPQGIFIKGHELWFSQGNTMHSVEGLPIGTFERKMHNGGKNKQEQQIFLETTIKHRLN